MKLAKHVLDSGIPAAVIAIATYIAASAALESATGKQEQHQHECTCVEDAPAWDLSDTMSWTLEPAEWHIDMRHARCGGSELYARHPSGNLERMWSEP